MRVGVFDDAKGLGEEHRPVLGNKSAVGGGNVEFARRGCGGSVRQLYKIGGIVEVGRGRNSGRQGRGEVAVSDVGRRSFRACGEQKQKAGYYRTPSRTNHRALPMSKYDHSTC